LVCQQRQPLNPDTDALVGLQHLRNQKLSLQSTLDRRVMLEQPQLAANTKDQEAVTQSDTVHALTAPLTLFIGILSNNPEGRWLARQGWLSKADATPGWTAKFVVYASNSTAAEQEQGKHGDLLISGDPSPLHQTLFLMQYALVHYDVRFIMKAGDSSYIRVANLLQELQASCTNAACHNEGLYMGLEVKNSSVLVGPDGSMSRSSRDYWEHTHLKTHMPYMSGAGYILSGDLAHAVIDTARWSEGNDWLYEGLDDVTIGFWLMSLDIRRVNHSGIIIDCQGSFLQPATQVNRNFAERLLALTSVAQDAAAASKLRSSIDVCQQDLLVLSPIERFEEVLFINERLQQCQKLSQLNGVALEVAIRHANPCKPLLPHGKVRAP